MFGVLRATLVACDGALCLASAPTSRSTALSQEWVASVRLIAVCVCVASACPTPIHWLGCRSTASSGPRPMANLWVFAIVTQCLANRAPCAPHLQFAGGWGRALAPSILPMRNVAIVCIAIRAAARHDATVWHLIHLSTGEVFQLVSPEGGTWFLGFEADGEGFVCEDFGGESHAQLLKCDTLLRYEVSKQPGGAIDVIDKQNSQVFSLTDFLGKYITINGSLKVGLCSSWCDISAALHTRKQRPSADRIFWNLYDILSGLDIEVGSRGKSKYVYTMWASWESFFQRTGMPGVLRRSAPVSKGLKDSEVEGSHSCAFPTLGTCGVIALLARWSFADSKKRGGLTHEEDKAKCRQFLESFLRVLPERGWAMFLFRSGYCNNFPLLPDGSGPFKVQVGKCGFVTMAPFHDMADQRQDFRVISAMPGEVAHLMDILQTMVLLGDPGGSGFAQLCHSIGNMLDKSVAGRVDKGIHEEEVQVMVNDCMVLSATGTDWSSKAAVDRSLLAYLSDSFRMLRGQQHISFALDKSRVCGVAVANGCVVLPTNEAFWCVPQAPQCLPPSHLRITSGVGYERLVVSGQIVFVSKCARRRIGLALPCRRVATARRGVGVCPPSLGARSVGLRGAFLQHLRVVLELMSLAICLSLHCQNSWTPKPDGALGYVAVPLGQRSYEALLGLLGLDCRADPA